MSAFFCNFNVDRRGCSLFKEIFDVLELNHVMVDFVRACGDPAQVVVGIKQVLPESSLGLTVTDYNSLYHFFSVKTSKDIALTPSFINLGIPVYSISWHRVVRPNC